MKGKLWAVAAATGLWCGAVCAQTVDAPQLKSGDSWVVSRTLDRGPKGWTQKNIALAVERVQMDGLLVAEKVDGSPQPPVEKLFGKDWSDWRDINGTQQVVRRPLVFPLSAGKKWSLEYTQANPNPQHASETLHFDYAVTGWEDVDVPAGHFKALKIECDGHWTAVVAAAVTSGTQTVADARGVTAVAQSHRTILRTVGGRLYDAYWYVPSQKRLVKAIEESYNSGGIRTERITEELVSSKLGS